MKHVANEMRVRDRSLIVVSSRTEKECCGYKICGLLTRMYFFVQIERALLREGLEADGALERPLPCAATHGHGGTEKQNKTTMDK